MFIIREWVSVCFVVPFSVMFASSTSLQLSFCFLKMAKLLLWPNYLSFETFTTIDEKNMKEEASFISKTPFKILKSFLHGTKRLGLVTGLVWNVNTAELSIRFSELSHSKALSLLCSSIFPNSESLTSPKTFSLVNPLLKSPTLNVWKCCLWVKISCPVLSRVNSVCWLGSRLCRFVPTLSPGKCHLSLGIWNSSSPSIFPAMAWMEQFRFDSVNWLSCRTWTSVTIFSQVHSLSQNC